MKKNWQSNAKDEAAFKLSINKRGPFGTTRLAEIGKLTRYAYSIQHATSKRKVFREGKELGSGLFAIPIPCRYYPR
jgi:hypothetical protein